MLSCTTDTSEEVVVPTQPTRRTLLKSAGAALALPVVYTRPAEAAPRAQSKRSRFEAADTPKLSLEIGQALNADAEQAAAAARAIVQLGVTHVLRGGPPLPWAAPAPPPRHRATRRHARPRRRSAHSLDGAAACRHARSAEGERPDAREPDDRRVQQRHLQPAGQGRRHREGDRVHQ